MINLDFIAAQAATKLETVDSKDKQNAVEKSISVLSSQGIFAMFLYMYAKKGGKIAEVLLDTLREQEFIIFDSHTQLNNPKKVLDSLTLKLNNFQKIRFIEDVVMRILTYARHYYKSINEKE